ncbi:MAG: hypothetical protein OEQ28_02325 [Acidobacteriota bacterium]|nr:hypothetical protein [Acidobacteriota bacterium]
MIKKIAITAAAVFLTAVSVSNVSPQSDPQPESAKTNARRIIVSVINGRVRSAPNLNGKILQESVLGTQFTAVSEENGWEKIEFGRNVGGEQEHAWISKSITEEYDSKNPGVQFQKFAQRYLTRKQLSFAHARQLFEVLPSAADDAKTFEVGGDLRLKSLIALSKALKAIPFGKQDNSPYKEFLAKYSGDVAYSEPAGEWYVRSQRFWELHERYKTHNVGEIIAWRAAGNPIPGECEGYINCYLYALRATEGEYLNFYPNGKFSKQAVQNINAMLQPIVSDVRTKTVYYTTSDISDRAEFNTMLAELRKIVSRTPFVEKQLVLQQIDQIAEGYR